jgi:DeoR/GlpR family transcriptional regulator of sugar metabolism
MREKSENSRVERARHLKILNILREHPTTSIRELADRLSISQSTIRRDLDELETQGLARRVFGGAILERQNGTEPPFEYREALNAEEKNRISRCAAALINDGDTIFIDGGTTTQFMIKYIAQKKNITVITCGLNVAYELNKFENITSFIVGGEIHKDSHSISGALALAVLDVYKIRCDKAFIAASAVSAQHGVTNRILDRIPLKRRAMEISGQSIVIADGSKIGTTALGQIAPITDFSSLVTDGTAPESELLTIKELNVQILIAE